MRSYISSSNKHYPTDSWLLTWLVAIALAGSILCVMEFFFRARGHRPSVISDQLLWAHHRHRVYDDGKKKTIVLLGASRIGLGFVPGAFEKYFPKYRVVQLAIDGTHPFASLRDLANDDRFTGIVICSIYASGFLRRSREDQQSFVDFYQKTYLGGCHLDDEFNLSVSTFLQKNLVINNYDLRWDEILMHLVGKKSLPARNYLVINSDRSISADYTKLENIVEHRRKRIQMAKEAFSDRDHPQPEGWLDQAMEINPLVQAIQFRGGQVVFVRYITTGDFYELEQKYYPRNKYWDQFAKMTSAVCVHFEDVPELSDFDCPDSSHLDLRDAPRFTVELGNKLCQLGVICQ